MEQLLVDKLHVYVDSTFTMFIYLVAKMICIRLWLLLVLPWKILGTTGNKAVQDFIEMVNSNLTACENYILPVNNEKLCFVSSSENEKIHDFGTFDFIIVGAGSAGTLLANRLTEVKEWNVVLLEAGGQENDFSDIPGMSVPLYFTDMNWGYLTTPQKRTCRAMDQNKCVCPRGKVLGGSSTINAKMYSRGNKHDFDIWEKMGNPGWSYKDVLPYFKKIENCRIYNPDSGYRGFGGLLDVNYTDPTVFTSSFIKAKEELGYKLNDYNGRHQIGVSQVQFTINGNKIASGGRAFIDPFLGRNNLNVTIKAFVTKLLMDTEKKMALGVEFIKNGRRYHVKAKREVILSAGAINTPQILMLSGIGPKEEMNKIGVKTLIDLPVGKGMEDHATFYGLNFATNQTLFNDSLEVLLQRYLNNQRPFTAGFNADSISFINVNNKESSVPDIEQLLLVPPPLGHFAIKMLNINNGKALGDPYSTIHLRLILLHPKSRGSVTLKSSNPLDFPDIDYNYYAEEEDMETMHEAIQETLKLVETKAFKSINATYIPALELCTDHKQNSKAYWHCMIEHMTSTLFHVAGTTSTMALIAGLIVSLVLTSATESAVTGNCENIHNNRYACSSFDLSGLPEQGKVSVAVHTEKLEKLKEIVSNADFFELEIENSVSAVEPNFLKGLKGPVVLTLKKNAIPVITPESFGNLNISSVVLEADQISEIKPDAFKNSKMDLLRIVGNDLREITKGVFHHLDLKQLDMFNNKISTIEDGALADLPNLYTLKLENNALTSFEAKKIFGNLPNLQVLHLQHNNLGKLQGSMFKGLQNLFKLLLGSNHIIDIEPGTFNLPSLRKLDLGNNKIKKLDNNIFKGDGLKSVWELFLHNNELTFLSTDFLAQFPNLQKISLAGNPWQCSCLDLVLKWIQDNIAGGFQNARPDCIDTNQECKEDYSLSENELDNFKKQHVKAFEVYN